MKARKTEKELKKQLRELENKSQDLGREISNVKRETEKIFLKENLPVYQKKYNNTFWAAKREKGNNQYFAYFHAVRLKELWKSFNGEAGGVVSGTLFSVHKKDGDVYIHPNSVLALDEIDKQISKKEFLLFVSDLQKKIKSFITIKGV